MMMVPKNLYDFLNFRKMHIHDSFETIMSCFMNLIALLHICDSSFKALIQSACLICAMGWPLSLACSWARKVWNTKANQEMIQDAG